MLWGVILLLAAGAWVGVRAAWRARERVAEPNADSHATGSSPKSSPEAVSAESAPQPATLANPPAPEPETAAHVLRSGSRVAELEREVERLKLEAETREAEALHSESELEQELVAGEVWSLRAASEFRPDALPPLLLAAQDAARAREMIATGPHGDRLLFIVGSEGRVNGQVAGIAADYRQMFARERIQDAKRKHATDPPVVPVMTDEQVLRLFLAQVEELASAVDALPQQHELTETMGRKAGAGRLVLHLWSLEGMSVPDSAAQFWKLRQASVEQCAQALRHPPSSTEAREHWEEASRLLKKSAELEPALYREAGSQPDSAAAARSREVARAQAEQVRRESLHSAVRSAQLAEDRARREVQSIRSRPQSRAAINRSSLEAAEAMLRSAEEWTRKTQREYEDYIRSRRR
jgi:hypothetical protein